MAEDIKYRRTVEFIQRGESNKIDLRVWHAPEGIYVGDVLHEVSGKPIRGFKVPEFMLTTIMEMMEFIINLQFELVQVEMLVPPTTGVGDG